MLTSSFLHSAKHIFHVGVPGFGASEEAVVGETEMAFLGDDKMVEDLDFHELAGIFDFPGDLQVGVGRGEVTGGVVVAKDHGGG